MYNDYSMMNPGGPGGVSITGKWINKRTGRSVIVRDNIIGENGMQVRCSDGSFISMQEFSRDYIQESDEIYDNNGNVIGSEPANSKDLMYDISGQTQLSQNKININDIEPTTYNPDMLNMPLNELQEAVKEIQNKEAEQTDTIEHKIIDNPKETNSNTILIDKIFKKTESSPDISLTIDWADFPEKEINTLINFLDVTPQEIAEFIYNTYVNKEAIKDMVITYITKKCNI